MQRRLCVKLLSRLESNSSFLKAKANPLHHQLCSRYFSTHSNSQNLWKYCGFRTTGFSEFVQNGYLRRSRFCNDGRALWFKSGRFFHSFDSKYHGGKSLFRRLTTDGVVLGLFVTNVAVFMLWRVADRDFMEKNFMLSVDNFTRGRVHTLITSAFSHSDTGHLIPNMVGLYVSGTRIGRVFGPEYMLKLYLSGALFGSIFFLAYHAFIVPPFQGNQTFGIDPMTILGLGASGAVNATFLLYIFLFPARAICLDLIIPVPAIFLGLFIIGKDVVRILEGDDQISGSAHLGGATVAAIAWLGARKGRLFRQF